MTSIIVATIGVGYVGLQTALYAAKSGLTVIAFDTNLSRIAGLKNEQDSNQLESHLKYDNLHFTSDPNDLKQADIYIVAVPTPINVHNVPNLESLKSSAMLVGQYLEPQNLVILESTVFPGATRLLFLPILEECSKLRAGIDFYLSYSPERIVPGSKEHCLLKATKIVSGIDESSLAKVNFFYEELLKIKTHKAGSMEVAESSKLLENIQRDVNIALMNEFAQIADAMDISFHEVLEAAMTKWNFIPFKPGLVGGHCIPEDPWYLMYQAAEFNASCDLIATSRQVNEKFIKFISSKCIRLLSQAGIKISGAKVALLGVAFKANTCDLRHSLTLSLYRELHSFNLEVLLCDPLVENPSSDYKWVTIEDMQKLDGIILCQDHGILIESGINTLLEKLVDKGVFIDIPGSFVKEKREKPHVLYWGL